MILTGQAAPAHHSVASARAYLARAHSAAWTQFDGLQARPGGFALYFTVISAGRRFAAIVKVCEDRRGRVTGSSTVSDGEPTC